MFKRGWGMRFIVVMAVLMLGLAWSGCGGNDDEPQSSEAKAPAAQIADSGKVEPRLAPEKPKSTPTLTPTPAPSPTPIQPGAISGIVLDDLTSATISFATVILRNAVSATTDTLDGSFVFDHLPLGDFTLRGAADGYSTASLNLTLTELTPKRHVKIHLMPQASVAGRVVLGSGEPLEGASVYISYAFHLDKGSTNKNGPETQSDSIGEFLIKGVGTGRTFNVVATHPDFATAYKGMFKLDPGHREEGVVIVLQPGGTIRGLARDSEGHPIPEAEVRASDATRQMMGNNNMMRIMMASQSGNMVKTDEEGKFEFKNLAPGSFLILAQHEGFQSNFTDNVALASGAAVEGLEIVLAPGAIFSGVVKSSAGEAVSKARVNISLIDLQRPVFGSKTTDDQGAFRFDTLRPGKYMLDIDAGEFPNYRKMNQEVPKEDVVIVLPEGGLLTGRVTDETSGQPVSKFTVRIKKAPGLPLPFAGDMGGMNPPTVKTFEDADGKYEIKGLEAGLYIALVMSDDFAPAQKMGVTITDAKETIENFVLNKGLVLKGRVVEAGSRNPISGAKVNLKDSGDGMDMLDMMGIDELSNRSTLKTQTTNIDGEFAFSHLMPGMVKLQAAKSDFVDQTKQVTIEDGASNDIEILMEKGATIRGRIVDAASKEPLAGAKVSIAGSGMFARMMAEFRQGEMTGADGQFIVRTIPEGKAGLVVNRDGYAMFSTDKFTVYNNQEYNIGDIALTSGGRIAGAVTKARQPVAGAAITALGPSGIKMTTTGEDGRYEIASLEKGAYQVSLINSPEGGLVFGGNMQTIQKNTNVTDGETTELDFEIPGGFNLTGIVLKGGEPMEGWTVAYGPKGGATSQGEQGGGFASTGEDGRFSFTGLANGEYQVSVTKSTMSPGAFPIPMQTKDVVIADADAHVEITVPGASIGGIVVNKETGAPVVSATIQLIEDGVAFSLEDIADGRAMGFYSATTGADGRFLIENVEEKTWQIVAQHADYSPAQTMAALDAGEQRLDLRLEMEKGATLKGRAYSQSTGVRVPRVTFQFYDGSGRLETTRTVNTDAQGNFTMAGLGAGAFSIEGFAENYAPVVGLSVTLSVDSENSVVAQFPDGGTLELSVTDAGGAPVIRARAQIILEQTGRALNFPPTLEHLIAFQEWTFTNQHGRLTHPNLPPGSHLLRVTLDGYQPVEQRIDVIDGQKSTLAVTMEKVE